MSNRDDAGKVLTLLRTIDEHRAKMQSYPGTHDAKYNQREIDQMQAEIQKLLSQSGGQIINSCPACGKRTVTVNNLCYHCNHHIG